MSTPACQVEVTIVGTLEDGTPVWRAKCKVCEAHTSEIVHPESVMLWIVAHHIHHDVKKSA